MKLTPAAVRMARLAYAKREAAKQAIRDAQHALQVIPTMSAMARAMGVGERTLRSAVHRMTHKRIA